jgi:hypothetical protein
MPKPVVLTVIAGALLGWAGAATSDPRPAVVELYTSEGCSSCPPAEAYLGELARRRDVLALSFHVAYWDNLGWPDRYALAESLSRQRGYARVLAKSSVYTPQVVIDGRADFVGNDRRAIGEALAAPRDQAVSVTLGARDGSLLIDIGPLRGGATSEILLIAYQRRAVAKVLRGENAGRELEEFNIVRSLHTLGRWDGAARQFSTRIDALPPGATDVAVLVQPLGLAPIIGAATLPL